MKLLVIVLCLLSERFLIHSVSFQRFNWFGEYYLSTKKLMNNNVFNNPWFHLALIVLPIVLITYFIYLLLHTFLFGFFGFLTSLIIFFYCLGPQNVYYPIVSSNTDIDNNTVGTYLIDANNQVFAVIFWFLLGGPIMALIYRLFSLCLKIPAISVEAHQIVDILDWIPSRLTVLLYLLVGNFQRGFPLFIKFFISNSDKNNQMLRECGLQAVRINDTDSILMPDAENLVEHAIIVLLVVIALFSFVWW